MGSESSTRKTEELQFKLRKDTQPESFLITSMPSRQGTQGEIYRLRELLSKARMEINELRRIIEVLQAEHAATLTNYSNLQTENTAMQARIRDLTTREQAVVATE
ncbi:hypothetical protein EDC01DRAFT_634526 [Geopyxis carbonaria]|nr:hypothetical protein EDC01DRAFT_634526 [Geopyxis carbonaria]